MNKKVPYHFSKARCLIFAYILSLACSEWPIPAYGSDAIPAIGRAALDDGLYSLAIEKFEMLLKNTSDPSQKSRYALKLSDALYGIGEYGQMLDIITKYRDKAPEEEWADKFDAHRVFALFGLEKWDDVLNSAREFEQKHPDSSFIPSMIRLRASAYEHLDRLEEACTLFAQFAENHEGSPDWPENLLNWGRALAAAERYSEALAVFERLNALELENRIGDEGRIGLGRLYARTGDKEKARTVIAPLLTRAKVPDPVRARALNALIDISETQNNITEMLAILDKGLAQIGDPALKAGINLHKGKLMLQTGRTDEGIALVREFVASKANSGIAGDVQLELAGILSDKGYGAKALLEYQHYLGTFSDPSGVARAHEGQGWALCMLDRHEEAVESFEKARTLSSEPWDRARCLFKTGDCHYAAHRFARALEIYELVMQKHPETPLADQALFQIARINAVSGETEKAETFLWSLVDRDHMGPLVGKAMLNIARLKETAGKLDDALAIYALIYEGTDRKARERALYGIGDIHYRKGMFEKALRYFEEVAEIFHDGPVADLAFYMCGWCYYMLGEDEIASERFNEFIKKFPDSPWTPHAVFWAGEHAYNRGAYKEAEKGFMKFVREYPSSSLADTALFCAGRAALMQRDFRRSNEYFALLIKDYPKSAKHAEARFFQGEALCEMGEFSAAILVFDEIIKRIPTSYLAEMAWFRKGDSQYTLGSEDPARYEEAITSYRTLLNSPDASEQARWEAEYKIGRCFEKLKQEEEAFEYYMKVVYSYIESQGRNPRSNIWFTRAAFNAAEIKERQKNWAAAVNIYQRVVSVDIPASRDARERINRIRMDHWLFFY